MDPFKSLLRLQCIWLAAAISVHIVSLMSVLFGSGSLFANSPVSSIIGMSIFIPIIYLGWRSRYLAYGILNGICISLIFYKGYLFQVLAIFQPDGLAAFPSVPAWVAGVAINTLGVPLGFYLSYRALKLAVKGSGVDQQAG